jgi:hypothetical protein
LQVVTELSGILIQSCYGRYIRTSSNGN